MNDFVDKATSHKTSTLWKRSVVILTKVQSGTLDWVPNLKSKSLMESTVAYRRECPSNAKFWASVVPIIMMMINARNAGYYVN